MSTRRWPFPSLIGCLLLLIGLSGCVTKSGSQRETGTWNLPRLTQTPPATWGNQTGLVQEVFYEGEPLNGKSTRVFAYLGRPADRSTSPRPAMVLVHGGGGKAFKDWAEHWARRGYVALAMDLAGNGPDGRLPDGGPDQSDAVKFRDFTSDDAVNMWSHHAVAAVVRGHSLLRSLPDVDPDRIGITGISWGGYLTCIVAGIDPRLKVAVPVYGCGFLGDNSYWKDRSIAAMTPDARQRWLHLFDPGSYLAQVTCPILFLNGTTDFAYPLDSYQKSYRLVPEPFRQVSVVVGLPHGHIWTFPEVDVFVDQVLKQAPPLPRFTPPVVDQGQLIATLLSDAGTGTATLSYTTNTGPWHERVWLTAPATVSGNRISAPLPSHPDWTAFLSWTDPRGLRVSSEHAESPE